MGGGWVCGCVCLCVFLFGERETRQKPLRMDGGPRKGDNEKWRKGVGACVLFWCMHATHLRCHAEGGTPVRAHKGPIEESAQPPQDGIRERKVSQRPRLGLGGGGREREREQEECEVKKGPIGSATALGTIKAPPGVTGRSTKKKKT